MSMLRRINRRHSPNRRKTRVDAVMTMDDAHYPVTIRDISYTGMKLSVPVDVQSGTPVTLYVLSHQIPAIVHWYRDGMIGIHLLDRLDGDTLRALENAEDDLAAFR